MVRLFVALLASAHLLGCATLKEQYEGRSQQIQEYCQSVFKDAGYGEKIYKKSMAECLSKTEDREQIKAKLMSIALSLVLISTFGITLTIKTPPF